MPGPESVGMNKTERKKMLFCNYYCITIVYAVYILYGVYIVYELYAIVI